MRDIHFSFSDPQELAANDTVELFFLALPHGIAVEFAKPLVNAGKRVIDLSADFRLNSASCYKEYYGIEHPDPELLTNSVYVVPELLTNPHWKDIPLIACPGCYPTSIQIPLIPLLRANLIPPEGIVINSFSGISGAGKKAEEFYSFCERDENAVAYGLPRHRHLSEIEEQLSEASGKQATVQFMPHLAPMKRGIITTISTPANNNTTLENLYSCWESAFSSAPFVSILSPGTFPGTADVVGTNRIDISAVHDSRTGNFIITSALDNLLKGASGQAIQIMNLIYGHPEISGLR